MRLQWEEADQARMIFSGTQQAELARPSVAGEIVDGIQGREAFNAAIKEAARTDPDQEISILVDGLRLGPMVRHMRIRAATIGPKGGTCLEAARWTSERLPRRMDRPTGAAALTAMADQAEAFASDPAHH